MPVTSHGYTFLLPRRPDTVQLAATLGGCALAGLAVIAGFLVVRRRSHFAATVPLPRGLFPLAAGIVLLGLAVVEQQGTRRLGTGWLPRVSGLRELTAGGAVAAAALLGACCVLRALVMLGEAAVQPREPVLTEETVLAEEPAFTGETVRAGRAYAAEAGLTAGQWLGSFLLLSALIAGVLAYVERDGFTASSQSLAAWEAVCAGGGLAGALLFASVILARHRREARRARVRLPRWLTLRATAALLAAIAVGEYWIFASNANGRLNTAEAVHPAWEGLYWVVVGAQFAAMLMGAACLGRWILAGWRAVEKASPDSANGGAG
jgi:hypothetical protein